MIVQYQKKAREVLADIFPSRDERHDDWRCSVIVEALAWAARHERARMTPTPEPEAKVCATCGGEGRVEGHEVMGMQRVPCPRLSCEAGNRERERDVAWEARKAPGSRILRAGERPEPCSTCNGSGEVPFLKNGLPATIWLNDLKVVARRCEACAKTAEAPSAEGGR